MSCQNDKNKTKFVLANFLRQKKVPRKKILDTGVRN